MRDLAFNAAPGEGRTEPSARSKAAFALVLFGLIISFACSNGKDIRSEAGPTKQSLPGANSNDNRVGMDTGVSTNSQAFGPGELRPEHPEYFWQNAAEGGMAEVEMGRLAASKAQSGDVKAFGERMVADHGKANAELKNLARAHNINLLEALSPDHRELMSRLEALSGADFDRVYVDAMVAAHEKDVAMFKTEAESGANGDLKTFAAKTLPTLEEHLQMIRTIKAAMAQPQQTTH